jgi:hypothetical protein
MSKIVSGSIYRIMMGLALVVSIALSAGAADDPDVYDTVELQNGDKLTGTVLYTRHPEKGSDLRNQSSCWKPERRCNRTHCRGNTNRNDRGT